MNFHYYVRDIMIPNVAINNRTINVFLEHMHVYVYIVRYNNVCPVLIPSSLPLSMENITDHSGFSGMLNESNATDNTDNGTEFNCFSRNISSSRVTNTSFWEITLSDGAPAVATVFGIYFLIAFGWNLLIVVTFLKKRKLLQEPANVLLLNLAIADLMVSLTQMFFSMVTEAAERFIFGASDVVRCGMCDFVGVFFMLLYGVSMHTLAALSFDRFLLLYKPFRYKKIMTQRNSIILVVVIWIIACLLALPPVIGFGQIEFNRRFGSCVPRFGGVNIRSNIMNFVYIVYVALESLFPIITIAFCSFWTYRFVNKFLRRNYIRRSSFYNRRQSDGATQLRHEDTRYHHQQQQLVKVFGALLVSNVVSWLPVFIVVIAVGVLGDADDVPDEIYVVGWICFLTAPVFHPIIESFFVKDMRLVVCKGIMRVNRAGSFIARSTTGMFGNKDIELANEKAGEEEYKSERKIKFFGKRPRGMSTVSMTTEVTEIPPPSSRDNTPSPRIAQKRQDAKRAANKLDIEFRTKQANSTPSSKPARRITFSDESTPTLPETPPIESRNGIRKSVLKSPRANEGSYLSPLGELDAEDTNSSADGSVFNSPESPQQADSELLGIVTDTSQAAGTKAGVREGVSASGEPENPVPTVPCFANVGSEEKLDANEGASSPNDEAASDLKLLGTVYNERRGSWTLV